MTIMFASCKKNFSDETYTPEILVPGFPDLATSVTASVTGFVNDAAGNGLYGAYVTAGNKSATTDEYGYFKIENVSVPKNAGFVKVSKAGYFFGYKTFLSREGKANFVRLQLMEKTNTGDINSTAGGTVNTSDGAAVTLPANAVVTAAGSAPYSGTIHVAARRINSADINTAPLQLPGDGRGTDTEGRLKQLRSFGCLAVELTGDAGQLLQIAAGKQATVNIPIAATIAGSAPATTELWSFDETKGLWKQEGTAVKSGNNYTASVSHFSFWEGATGVPMVNFSVQVVDANLNPIANTAVMLTLPGQPYNAGYGTFGFTDANGFVQGPVFANSSMILDVLTPCHIAAYTQNITTGTTDLDLGTITAGMGQSSVTFTGTLKNCLGQPVTDGYIQFYDNGFYNRINVTNGTFNFATSACINGPVTFVAIDNTTHQQGIPQTLTPGVNNLGNLTACGTSTLGVINYTIDGVSYTLAEPADTLGGYFLDNGPAVWTQVLKISQSQNTNPQIAFQFDGGMAIGSAHNVYEIFSISFPGNRGTSPGLPVTITEYGNLGGFMSGSFSGTVMDFSSTPVPHTISCNFRVRRNN